MVTENLLSRMLQIPLAPYHADDAIHHILFSVSLTHCMCERACICFYYNLILLSIANNNAVRAEQQATTKSNNNNNKIIIQRPFFVLNISLLLFLYIIAMWIRWRMRVHITCRRKFHWCWPLSLVCCFFCQWQDARTRSVQWIANAPPPLIRTVYTDTNTQIPSHVYDFCFFFYYLPAFDAIWAEHICRIYINNGVWCDIRKEPLESANGHTPLSSKRPRDQKTYLFIHARALAPPNYMRSS